MKKLLAAGPCGRPDVVFGDPQDLEVDDAFGAVRTPAPLKGSLADWLASCFRLADEFLQSIGLSKSVSGPRPLDVFGRSSRLLRASQPAVSFKATFTGDKGYITRTAAKVNNPPNLLHEVLTWQARKLSEGSRLGILIISRTL
ncbi:hypothetical protein [Paludisphaera borealis]|uniref:hypothetical protein n=1 Tax=Paludisphaera borealis TaxID=1387353 RepID=UPI0011AB594B|nr:hypothetical protein [Paludisphaera borealis]